MSAKREREVRDQLVEVVKGFVAMIRESSGVELDATYADLEGASISLHGSDGSVYIVRVEEIRPPREAPSHG